MESLSNLRTIAYALAVAVLLFFGASERAVAALLPTDVLLGRPYIDNSNWAFLGPTLTPGVAYGGPGASITFDLGGTYPVNGFGITGEAANPGIARTNWSTVRLEFSDSPTFISETVTNIVLTPLVTTGVMETKELSDTFFGRYVR